MRICLTASLRNINETGLAWSLLLMKLKTTFGTFSCPRAICTTRATTVNLYMFTHFPFAERICVTVAGASKGKPCIFPFKFNGVTYSECTWNQAHLTEHKAWCSTLVDASGTHVGGQGKWGNCGPGCPVPPDDRNNNGTAAAPPTPAPPKTDGKTMRRRTMPQRDSILVPADITKQRPDLKSL